MTAPSLFDAPAAVRFGDPPTSQEAAASLPPRVLSAQRRRVLEQVAWEDAWYGDGATAFEVHRGMMPSSPDQSIIARRLTDLRDLGLVVASDRTRPGRSGRSLIVWTITPLGRETLE